MRRNPTRSLLPGWGKRFRRQPPRELFIAVVLCGLFVAIASAQSSSGRRDPASLGSASPTPTPTPVIPELVLTPGGGGVSTGSSGTNVDGIPPETTPVGFAPYSFTPKPSGSAPGTPGPGGRRPATAADCRDNWQSYSALGFRSAKNCEDWVELHPSAGVPGTTPSGTPRVPAPKKKRTPRPRSTPPPATPTGTSG